MSEDNPPEGAIQPPARYAVHKYMGGLYHLDDTFRGVDGYHHQQAYWYFNNYWLAWGCSQRLAKQGYIAFSMIEPKGRWPVAGAAVCAAYSVDGGPFLPCANPVFEICDGEYGINLSHEVTQGNRIALHFTATGTVPTDIIVEGLL